MMTREQFRDTLSILEMTQQDFARHMGSACVPCTAMRRPADPAPGGDADPIAVGRRRDRQRPRRRAADLVGVGELRDER
jgi:hypothetical protein